MKILVAKEGKLWRYGLRPDNGMFTAKAILEFQKQGLAGFEPDDPSREYKTTMPVMETNRSYVKTAVSTNFAEVVFNSEASDVFVEFYAPWCSHCKRFARPYSQIAKRFAEEPSIKFVAYDDSQNELNVTEVGEVPEVRGYPTLYHFSKGSKVPVKYPHPLTPENLDSLVGYMKANVSKPFKSYGALYGKDCDLCRTFFPARCWHCVTRRIKAGCTRLGKKRRHPQLPADL